MKGKHKGKKGSKTDNSQQKLKSGKQNKVKQQINPELLFSDDTPESKFFLLKQGFAKYMDPFGNECVSTKFKETMEDDALTRSYICMV